MVVLQKDEYEVLRLVDYEHMTHEECAARMDISRTTVTEICEAARAKLVGALVNGRGVTVSGGHTRVCEGGEPCCGSRGCWRGETEPAAQSKGGKASMKVAVTYENGEVFQHFGHTETFKLYDIEDGKIVSSQVIGSDGSGHSALAGLLRNRGVDALICGGIGGGARIALAKAGVALYPGVTGSADEAAQALAEGRLVYDPDTQCAHHEHGEGHDCAHHDDHACGHHCGR